MTNICEYSHDEFKALKVFFYIVFNCSEFQNNGACIFVIIKVKVDQCVLISAV